MAVVVFLTILVLLWSIPRRFCAQCGAPLPMPCPGGGIAFEANEPNEWQTLVNAGAFAGWPLPAQ